MKNTSLTKKDTGSTMNRRRAKAEIFAQDLPKMPTVEELIITLQNLVEEGKGDYRCGVGWWNGYSYHLGVYDDVDGGIVTFGEE